MPFITFEGVDAAGKSTQINLLQMFLESAKHDVICTKESGGTTLGEEIRQLVQQRHDLSIHPLSEALLYAADRAQHVNEVIRPALARGAFVLCDRYIDSSLAYQGVALPRQVIREINKLATSGLEADLTILLDLDVNTAKERMLLRGMSKDRIEARDDAYHESVRRLYLELADEFPDRIYKVDGSNSMEESAYLIRRKVIDCFGINSE